MQYKITRRYLQMKRWKKRIGCRSLCGRRCFSFKQLSICSRKSVRRQLSMAKWPSRMCSNPFLTCSHSKNNLIVVVRSQQRMIELEQTYSIQFHAKSLTVIKKRTTINYELSILFTREGSCSTVHLWWDFRFHLTQNNKNPCVPPQQIQFVD